MNEPEQQPALELDESEVAAYLQEHPDFLQRYPQVLEVLEFHHQAGAAVSLIERQVASLRRDNKQAHSKLEQLISTARENELRVQHLNALARVLIIAQDSAALVSGLGEFLRREMGVDALFIGLRPSAEATAQADELFALEEGSAQMHAVTNAFRRGKPICGPLSDEQVAALFGGDGQDDGQDDVPVAPSSAAMVPLGDDEVRGVLVLGSSDGERFVPEMGTLFLELMGNLLTAAFRRQLGSDRI